MRAVFICLFCLSSVFCFSQYPQFKRLKDRYADYFPIGVAVNLQTLRGDEGNIVVFEFSSMTPENAMKMAFIHPKEKEYFWYDADWIVERSNFEIGGKKKVRGSTLCEHNQTPKWMFTDAKGDTVSKAVLLKRLKDHITTVVSRFKGKVYAWDVVNEAISDKPGEFYRPTLWYRIIGEEYITRAFQYAHEADPNALLFYNDNNETNPVKREKIIKLVTGLKKAGVPIHGVGMQGHYGINEPTRDQLEKIVTEFAATGLMLQITEMDVSIFNKEYSARERTAQEDTFYSDERDIMQRDVYKMSFEVFRKYKQYISGVTFKTVCDRKSWLDDFPVKGRKDYPSLIDGRLNPKSAYVAIAAF